MITNVSFTKEVNYSNKILFLLTINNNNNYYYYYER